MDFMDEEKTTEALLRAILELTDKSDSLDELKTSAKYIIEG